MGRIVACCIIFINLISVLSGQSLSIEWNTFLGGYSWQFGNTITIDIKGNLYVAGTSKASWGTPIHEHERYSGNYISVTKLSKEGELLWNTFLGSGDDFPYDIEIDIDGNIFIVGKSRRTWGNPINPHSGSHDVFLAKLTKTGHLRWNTFIEGNNEPSGSGVAINSSGEIYVTGGKSFLTKLSIDGTIISEYPVFNSNDVLGGGVSWTGNKVILDKEENIFIIGDGTNGIVINKFSKNNTLIWDTVIIGGRRREHGESLTIDDNGYIYIVGWLEINSPIWFTNYDSDIIVSKIDPMGKIIWQKFYGSKRAERGKNIISDKMGNIFIVGSSEEGWGYPINPHFQGFGWDITLIKISSEGDLLWHTFLGSEKDDFGNDLIKDKDGNLYLVGASYSSWGLPLRNHSWGYDIFVTKISELLD